MARLLDHYRQTVIPALREELGRSNVLDLPRLKKICLNMGLGEAIDDAKVMDEGLATLAAISGQAAAATRAKMSVSNFRLRAGTRIGCRVTLRRARMYEFLDRLINAAIPRIRDFRGLTPKSFDNQGNYSLGVDEITIFPEIDPDKVTYPLGLDITMVIANARTPDEGRSLLRHMGMPFREA